MPVCGKGGFGATVAGGRATSSLALEVEATSIGSPEWTPGGGTGVLNAAAQDVRARLQAQAATLQHYT